MYTESDRPGLLCLVKVLESFHVGPPLRHLSREVYMSEDNEAFAPRNVSGLRPTFPIVPAEDGRALRSV